MIDDLWLEQHVLEQISEDSSRRRHLPNNQRQHENDSRAETIDAETAA